MDSRIQQRREAAGIFKRACDGRLPLTSPLFNFREIAKQMLLLEDHLLHGNKYCPDCIRKHLMTIEAFAEEATTLDKQRKSIAISERIAEKARTWLETFADASDNYAYHDLAQEIRAIRKELVKQVHDPRGSSERVAALWVRRDQHDH